MEYIKYSRRIGWFLKEQLEYGELIFANNLPLEEITTEILNLDIIPIRIINPHPWDALQKIGVTQEFLGTIINAAKYECPWTENKYIGTLPIAIATFNKKKYPMLNEYQLDTDWHRTMDKDERFVPDAVEKSLLGHGYTFATLPSDGVRTLTLAALKMPNEDYLICLTYIWHNK
jgi:hypothetical protein